MDAFKGSGIDEGRMEQWRQASALEARRVKVGPRGRHATIPDGWSRVTDGDCRANDFFADTRTGRFRPAESDDIGLPADSFDCLIRKD